MLTVTVKGHGRTARSHGTRGDPAAERLQHRQLLYVVMRAGGWGDAKRWRNAVVLPSAREDGTTTGGIAA